ncbi:hypothetical protein AMELA_G00229500 [Ameiurus melas]|uniref:Uncharacterized protein n=1 Tax=Ameiurus melas TaxID=219545 RepID=A0A7J5ZWI4_AMEME|nr:hypothetical protein AMELA_G00229500 [Ameiurus melas]
MVSKPPASWNAVKWHLIGKKKMSFTKFISRPIIFSREVETRKLLLNQRSTESPVLMKQRLKSDTTPSHPNVSSGYQYSPLRFDKLIVAPPLAMHLNFKSHFTPLPSTLPLSGVKPWIRKQEQSDFAQKPTLINCGIT